MKFKWQNLLFKITVWLFLEIVLSILGLDDLADYSEFVLENKHYDCLQLVDRNPKFT